MDQCDNPRVPDVMADMAKGVSPHDAFAKVGRTSPSQQEEGADGVNRISSSRIRSSRSQVANPCVSERRLRIVLTIPQRCLRDGR